MEAEAPSFDAPGKRPAVKEDEDADKAKEGVATV